ncbi:ABC transporter ATP-binding protein [Brevibacillus sp. B_LB10_24]|uniref:ABC transporter ATP-binding protein n=1 Tax=Brevibacillus sp. B_LB10_24 TaxID=3380645 RepID=UPI0038BB978E
MAKPAYQSETVTETAALRVEGLGKRFGGLEILRDLSFAIAKGERRAFIGPNGAGKSTLFNMIAGDLAPSSGEVIYFGENVSRLPNYQRVRKGMVRTFQKNNLLNELTVQDNLLLVLQMRAGLEHVWYRPRLAKHFPDIYERADQLLETWGLADRRNAVVKNLSYGEQRQVEILLGIATEPRILLLDEPTAGMSHSETQYILRLLQQLPKDLTLLIIEHDMDVVFGLADQVTVLHNGGILLEGDPQAIQTDPRVYEIYFGQEGVL